MKLFLKYSIGIFLFAFILLCASCFTVNYSTRGGSMPEGAKTFSIQYAENQARIVEPNLSQEFTDAFKEYMQKNTNLVMVNSNAHIDFDATIVGYEPSTPSTVVAGDQASQNKFSITVRVKYSCNIKPELDFETSFTRFKLYDVNAEFEEVRPVLTKEILDEILDDIYKRAFANW